jgi:hypothetical protein
MRRLRVPAEWRLTLVLAAVALGLLAMLVFDLTQRYL